MHRLISSISIILLFLHTTFSSTVRFDFYFNNAGTPVRYPRNNLRKHNLFVTPKYPMIDLNQYSKVFKLPLIKVETCKLVLKRYHGMMKSVLRYFFRRLLRGATEKVWTLRLLHHEDAISRLMDKVDNDQFLDNLPESKGFLKRAILFVLRPPLKYKTEAWYEVRASDLRSLLDDCMIVRWRRRVINSREPTIKPIVNFDLMATIDAVPKEMTWLIMEKMGPYIRAFVCVCRKFEALKKTAGTSHYWLFHQHLSFAWACGPIDAYVTRLLSLPRRDPHYEQAGSDLVTILRGSPSPKILVDCIGALEEFFEKCLFRRLGLLDSLAQILIDNELEHWHGYVATRCRLPGSKYYRILMRAYLRKKERTEVVGMLPAVDDDLAWNNLITHLF
jgi:hypothetical protein